jgi:hypothetical protein
MAWAAYTEMRLGGDRKEMRKKGWEGREIGCETASFSASYTGRVTGRHSSSHKHHLIAELLIHVSPAVSMLNHAGLFFQPAI